MMLELRNLSSGYGAIEALKLINLRIDSGEIVTLIGANGAGKSTTLRNITGLVPATSGEILFEGRTLNGVPTHLITAMGICMVPEGRAIFANLTVSENLDMGAYLQTNKSENTKALDRVFTLFPRLKERRKQAGGTLSGGEQQMLAIGRALMGNPRVLLMDEPSEGLAPLIVAEVGRIIARLKQQGQSILLVEQNVKLALGLADDVVMLNTGRVAFTGSADEVNNNQALITQHLGVF